jgi:hypothetical protein
MADRLRTRARLLTLAGAGLVFLATSAAAFGGSVHSRRLAQGDPRLEQLQAGWEVYRIWCSACHAYSGEGLTPAWISTWAPDDQNCWQSKCHSLNHPDDGFFLPHFIPAVVGKGVLDHFGDGPTLYGYVSTLMPYQEPGVLSQDQYYAVLAQVLNMNGIDYGMEPLGPETISALALGSSPASALPAAPTVEAPEVHSMPPAAAAATPPAGPRPAAWLAGLLISLGLAAIASVAVAVEVRSSRE